MHRVFHFVFVISCPLGTNRVGTEPTRHLFSEKIGPYVREIWSRAVIGDDHGISASIVNICTGCAAVHVAAIVVSGSHPCKPEAVTVFSSRGC